MPDDYQPRLADAELEVLLQQLPALLLTGPRACGKTTTASRYAKTIIRLDEAVEAAGVAADPDVALRGLPEPVLLDEWQAVPSVLGAVKRAVDTDFRAGRFIVTGSVRAEYDAAVWPGTGRLVRVPVGVLAEREIRGLKGPLLIDRLAQGDLPDRRTDEDLRDLIGLALKGGFPEPALGMAERGRVTWFRSYMEQLLSRDTRQLGQRRSPQGLRRFLEAYALHSAAVVTDQTLHEAAGVDRKTGIAYEELLLDLRVAERLPAWTSSRVKRLVRQPKRILVDSALMGAALRLDVEGVLRDGRLLGRLLETFVLAQLRAEEPFAVSQPRLFHLRQREGRHEVDVVVELGGGRVIGLEVRATAAPAAADARHLAWLRDELGDRFVLGAVLHTGPRPFPLGERLVALPIPALWS